MGTLELFRCRVCGGELEDYGAGKYKCTHCNAIYKEADVKAYAEEIELAHERSKSYCEEKSKAVRWTIFGLRPRGGILRQCAFGDC